MNEVDDILGANPNNYKRNDKYSIKQNSNQNNVRKNNYNSYKNNWREEQQKARQEIYDTMNRKATEVVRNGNSFQSYLDMQSKFQKHSVGNCLVILDKMPNATQIKDKDAWNEKDIYIKENEVGIKILEPTKSNGRIFYNPKEVFDISQTNCTTPETTINYGDRRLLEAVLSGCDVPRKAVDTLKDGSISSEYNKQDNVLYVCRGMDRELLFSSLYREIASIEMKDVQDSDFKSFKCYCISYMLCKRYGIDTSNFNFSELPQEIANNLDGKVVRQELEKMRTNYEKINTKIMDYFDVSSKNKESEKKKSIPER